MADIVYKKFSELTQTTTLNPTDLFPIAQYISGIDYNSKSVTFQTLYNQTSGALIGPFTTSIQTAVNATLSSDTWNSTYSTVQSNSATWGATVADTLTAFSQGNISSPQVARFLSAGTTPNASVAFIATGTGATLAQLPDNGVGGGNARGQYATDWQKLRTDATQVASGNYSVIGGGLYNKVTGVTSIVAGGVGNEATNDLSTVAGGGSNVAAGVYSTIAGGYDNTASGYSTTIAGGSGNTASNSYAYVGGGSGNTASGVNSSVVGGQSNNTNNKQNAHIIGSNIVAVSADYTYVNNISSQGDVRASKYIRKTNYSTSIDVPVFTVNLANGEVQLFSGNITGNTSMYIYGMEEVGSQIKIYLRNTNSTARTITPFIVVSVDGGPNVALPLDMASSTTAGAVRVRSFSLAGLSGMAVVTANNVGGATYPYGHYVGSVQ